MSQFVGKAYHPINGFTEDIWEGFSWPCFFFGCFWFGYKGVSGWAVLSFLAAIITFGISWLVIPFFANEFHATSLRNRGYLSETEWNEKKTKVVTQSVPTEQPTGSYSKADEIEKLANLKDRGIISIEEFNQQKEKLLGG